MKEKKTKRTRKVLLMAIAAVLVSAVSVSATLAYLTAQTSSVTNTFTGSGGITGRVAEPNYDGDGKFTIDQPVSKDPLIENTTTDAAIYVGAQVSFWINVSGTTYTQVSPSVFYQFVDVQYNNADAASYNTGTGTTQWTSKESPSGDKSLYFIYNSLLTKSDSDPSYNTTTSAYVTGKDNTAPLFNSVTVKSAVNINANGEDTDVSEGPSGKTYAKFNYKIVINGYGQKAYAVNATSGAQEGDTLVTQAEATANIFTELKNITPTVTA